MPKRSRASRSDSRRASPIANANTARRRGTRPAPGERECRAPRPPDRQRKRAAQAVDEPVPDFLVQVDQDFSIAPGAERVAALDQLLAKLAVGVGLAGGGDGGGAR